MELRSPGRPGSTTFGADSVGSSSFKSAFILFPSTPTDDRRSRTNLRIIATGVTLVVTDPQIGVFELYKCSGLIVEGLTVTYDPLPYTQGEIIAVDAPNHKFDVTLDPGYLGLDDPRFTYGVGTQPPFCSNWGSLFDPTTGYSKQGTGWFDVVFASSAQHLSGASYRLTVDPAYWGFMPNFAVGDYFAYLMRRHDTNIFTLYYCDSTSAPYNRPPATISGCTALACPGGMVALNACPDITQTQGVQVQNCTIGTAQPGALVSVDAGGVFAANCRVGPLIEYCFWEQTLDDGIDIHSTARLFSAYPIAGNFSVVDLAAGPRIRVGDQLQFLDNATGSVSYRMISSISAGGPLPTDWKRVVLSSPLSGLVGDGVTLTSSTHVYSMNASCPGSIIRYNTMRNFRGHGAILSSDGGLMHDNTIERAIGMGAVVSNEYSWNFGEGPVPRAITVRGNTFLDCGFSLPPGGPTYFGSSILVEGRNASTGAPALTETSTDHVIAGNRILGWNTAAIYVQSASDVEVIPYLGTYNEFVGTVPSSSRAVTIAAPTSTTNVDGVDAALSSGLGYAVRIENGVSPSVTVTTNIVVNPPTLPLEDLR